MYEFPETIPIDSVPTEVVFNEYEPERLTDVAAACGVESLMHRQGCNGFHYCGIQYRPTPEGQCFNLRDFSVTLKEERPINFPDDGQKVQGMCLLAYALAVKAPTSRLLQSLDKYREQALPGCPYLTSCR